MSERLFARIPEEWSTAKRFTALVATPLFLLLAIWFWPLAAVVLPVIVVQRRALDLFRLRWYLLAVISFGVVLRILGLVCLSSSLAGSEDPPAILIYLAPLEYPGMQEDAIRTKVSAISRGLDPFGSPLVRSGNAIYSLGPDRSDQGGALAYDPTNGTVSTGDIVIGFEAEMPNQ